ncbi:condensation domain-containing protein [Amycolatopsis japonica]|uniref:condensation domain-containing protein n=1 Tax=Amycolatopsis japonica TaxID=208439 RepID=UPI0037ADE846
MAIGKTEASRGPTSLQEEARLSGEFADWHNLVLGAAWLTGDLDIGVVRDAWWRVCLRHDALRRAYVAEDEARTFADALSEVEFHTAATDAEAIELMRGILGVPFDLSGMGLSRIAIVRTGERRHLLGIALDHIITDELSWRVMINDFADFYRRGLEGEASAVADASTYQGFASLQRREIAGAWGEKRRVFWRSYVAEFGTFPPDLSARGRSGGTPSRMVLDHSLPMEVNARVVDLARRARVTPYAVIASSLLTAMREVTDDPNVGLVTDGFGRILPGTSQAVGLFVETVPLHLTRRMTDPLETVREVFFRSLDVFEYGLPPLVAGRLWGQNLVTPGVKPGVHLYLYDGRGQPKMKALAGTSAEFVRLEVPGGAQRWMDTIIVNCHLEEENPRFVATYNESAFPGDVVQQLLQVAVKSVSSEVNRWFTLR